MSNEHPILIHDGATDTTVQLRVDDGQLAVDHGDKGLPEAVRAVTAAFRLNLDTDKVLLLASPPRIALRVLSGSARQILLMQVVDGKLIAEYDPADLTEAAQQFVKAVTDYWAAEMDANRRFTAHTLEVVLRDAARQQSVSGDMISVEHAAELVAALMWGCR